MPPFHAGWGAVGISGGGWIRTLTLVSDSGCPCQNEFKVAQAIIRLGRGLGGGWHRVKKKIPKELSFRKGETR